MVSREKFKRIEGYGNATVSAVKIESGKEEFNNDGKPFRFIKTVKVVLDSRDYPTPATGKDKRRPVNVGGKK